MSSPWLLEQPVRRCITAMESAMEGYFDRLEEERDERKRKGDSETIAKLFISF